MMDSNVGVMPVIRIPVSALIAVLTPSRQTTMLAVLQDDARPKVKYKSIIGNESLNL